MKVVGAQGRSSNHQDEVFEVKFRHTAHLVEHWKCWADVTTLEQGALAPPQSAWIRSRPHPSISRCILEQIHVRAANSQSEPWVPADSGGETQEPMARKPPSRLHRRAQGSDSRQIAHSSPSSTWINAYRNLRGTCQ
jgi:hypothetical protein